MIKKQFLEEIPTTHFLQNFKDFRAKLKTLKNWQPVTFSKFHIIIYFHPRCRYVSHPQFLMGPAICRVLFYRIKPLCSASYDLDMFLSFQKTKQKWGQCPFNKRDSAVQICTLRLLAWQCWSEKLISIEFSQILL